MCKIVSQPSAGQGDKVTPNTVRCRARPGRVCVRPGAQYTVRCVAGCYRFTLLEPISKSPEEDKEAGELNKAQEVLGVVLPADEDSALPLDPGEEALNDPAAHIAG
jgi:hypothetical protein